MWPRFRNLGTAALLIGAGQWVSGCAPSDSLRVLSASSAQDTVRAAVSQSDSTIQVASGGSNSLVRQLASGAQADVLITADERTMSAAVDAGLTASDPIVVGQSRLVLVVPAGTVHEGKRRLGEISNLRDVDFADTRLVVCADPVPCGAATQRAFADAGIDPPVSSYEPSSRQALSKVAIGVADAAFVWDVDLRADARVAAAYSGTDLPVTQYRAVVLASSSRPDDAHSFIAELQSSNGQRLLAEHGFLPATTITESAIEPAQQGAPR